VILASRPAGARAGCFILTSGHTISGISGKKEVYVIFRGDRDAQEKKRATVVTYRDTADNNTARVSSRGANPPWYIDVPVPGQTFVTPLSEVKQFLARAGYAELLDSSSPATRFSRLR
jgi:hypothetical protein